MSTNTPQCCHKPMRYTARGYQCRKCGRMVRHEESSAGVHLWQGDVAAMEARRLERMRRERRESERDRG